MIYDMEKSGERIRQLRIQNGYTQEELAGVLSIDRSFYSRIETGKKGCSIDLFIHLSALFNVSLDYLILGRYHIAEPTNADKIQLKEEISRLTIHLKQFGSSI